MFCSSCGNKLLDNSQFCSKCGTDLQTTDKPEPKKKLLQQPLSELKMHKGLIVVLVFVVFFIVFKACSPGQPVVIDENTKIENACKKKTIEAKVMAESFLKDKLVSPSTAEFSGILDTKIAPIEDCSYKVIGFVDSQNSFGGQIRSSYIAIVQYNLEKDSWNLKDSLIK